jgi:hypothetical protein
MKKNVLYNTMEGNVNDEIRIEWVILDFCVLGNLYLKVTGCFLKQFWKDGLLLGSQMKIIKKCQHC